MWTNVAETERPQMKIWGMRIACWINKDPPHTRSEYVMLNDFHDNNG